jgi:hypothetical protein
MKQQNIASFFIIILVSALTGCATIVSKSSHPFAIRTEPKDAIITITDKKGKDIYKGLTNQSIRLKTSSGYFSRAEYQIKVTAPGYAEQVVPVTYKLNGWYFGNLLIGGALGMLLIDPISGAMWKPDTKDVDVRLRKTTASNTPTLNIVDINTLTAKEKEGLIRLK